MMMRFQLSNIGRRGLLLGMAACVIFGACQANQEQTVVPDKPNIILIMVDDMGYSDPGFIGGDIDTPNIDSLAREGVVFEQFYNNAKCSQTRASLLSGLYYQQARRPGPSGNLGHDQLAQGNNTTLAEVLKTSGYATALAGKWHLSGTPYERGFDRFFGFLNGANSHWDSSMVFGDYHSDADNFYSSDDFTDAGLSFLEEGVADGKPVFLYLAYSAPHYPLHAHEEDIERYKGRFSGGWDAVRQRRIAHMKSAGLIADSFAVSERLTEHQDWDQAQTNWNWDDLSAQEQADQERLMEVYAAMVDRVDWNIGRLLAKLRELDVDQNTVIFFLSDNGGSPYSKKNEPGMAAGPSGSFRTLNTPWAEVNSTPFNLFKRYSHEGGISTAMIARWPQGLPEPGRRNQDPYHVIDFMPTVIELAGASYPDSRHGDAVLPMAGKSFAPALTSTQAADPRKLFWEYQENYAMRAGRWKLVQSNLGKQWELYDMVEDRGETRNLIGEHPDIAEQMQQEWQAWHEAVSSAEQQPPWQRPSIWPDRIIATLTAHPATEFSVSWRTGPLETPTFAEIVPARSGARFDLGALQVAANSVPFSLDPDLFKGSRDSDGGGLEIDPVVYHSVKFSSLEADTLYAYRVQGHAGKWSSWRQLRTAPENGPVEFLYFGDAQNGLRDHISRVFETASIVAPDARFMLHTGDLVNSGINDLLWAGWFEAGGRFFGRVPSIPVPGNHDYSKVQGTDGKAHSELTPFWRAQFRLPVEKSLPEALHEAVYAIPYTSDLHLFAIDSTGPDFDGQMAWLAKQFEASDAKWRIVYLHHPYFSWVGVGKEKVEQTRRRKLFDAFLAQHDVDLVLSGHRHSYQRAESGPGVHQRDKQKPYQVDTVFLVTASTTQRGTTKVEGWEKWARERQGNFTLTRWGDYVPIFGVIRVDGDSLSYRGVDAVGQTYDEFRLSKDGKGRKTLHNGSAAFGPVWTKDTVGPYEEWSKHSEAAGMVQ